MKTTFERKPRWEASDTLKIRRVSTAQHLHNIVGRRHSGTRPLPYISWHRPATSAQSLAIINHYNTVRATAQQLSTLSSYSADCTRSRTLPCHSTRPHSHYSHDSTESFRYLVITHQLLKGYRATGGVLPADPDSHGREPLRKISVHSASVCTRHGDELRIVIELQWQRTVEAAMLHHGACPPK